jgi:hypothetical protein
MTTSKSFYIFDFDENMIHTGSMAFIYHKQSGEELGLASAEFMTERWRLGKEGPYKDYYIDPAPMKTYRAFGDSDAHGHYPFLEDLKKAVGQEGWQGPSWQRFVKAVTRERTIAIITARGHHPDQIHEGLVWMAQQKLLPREPEILQIYTVTHPHTKNLIRWTGDEIIAAMKKQALHHFIEEAYDRFGHEPPHRFGFSDDDPRNIASTREKFLDLKMRNPHHSFFLYEARPKQVIEEEVTLSQPETR